MVSAVDDELATRAFPWSELELAWQRVRPPEHRVPLPRTGQRVYVRLDRFYEPLPARVAWAPDLERGWRWEDLEPGASTPDAWTWQLRRDNLTGRPVLDAMGLPRVELLPDPQPVIGVRVDGWPSILETREARLRGSPGWLPLDWRERWRPGPHHGWTEETRQQMITPQPHMPLVTRDGEMV